jgi:hypothetical protein
MMASSLAAKPFMDKAGVINALENALCVYDYYLDHQAKALVARIAGKAALPRRSSGDTRQTTKKRKNQMESSSLSDGDTTKKKKTSLAEKYETLPSYMSVVLESKGSVVVLHGIDKVRMRLDMEGFMKRNLSDQGEMPNVPFMQIMKLEGDAMDMEDTKLVAFAAKAGLKKSADSLKFVADKNLSEKALLSYNDIFKEEAHNICMHKKDQKWRNTLQQVLVLEKIVYPDGTVLSSDEVKAYGTSDVHVICNAYVMQQQRGGNDSTE